MQIEFKIWSFKKKWPNERLFRKEAFFPQLCARHLQ